MNPMKLQYLREEVQYLLDNDFIEPSQSDWMDGWMFELFIDAQPQ